jgi:type III restriction enzyme
VLRLHQGEIARLVHTQMQQHFWSAARVGYDVSMRGSNALKAVTYTAADEVSLHFRVPPSDKVTIAQHLYGGFQRCLYPVQKFQSDPERMLALILDRDTLKWFKPARGQFQLFYRSVAGEREYQPDFVAETGECIYMLEAKARNEMNSADVIAKCDAAVAWCRHASTHGESRGGKPWTYVLIPHDAIAENVTVDGLTRQFACPPSA